MQISLTFDNGPIADVTPTVLAVLARRGVAATFFVNGKNLGTPSELDLVRRAYDEGHLVGNHTFTHRMPLGALDSGEEAIAEIARTQELMQPFASKDKLFRPTGGTGVLNGQVLCSVSKQYLLDNAFSCVTWNCVPGDWIDPVGWVDVALEFASSNPWSVVVLHDTPRGGTRSLDDFIVKARDQLGATFTQAFPVECVPIWRGVAQFDMSHLVTQR